MQLTDLFIRRPVLAICVNLLILVFGVLAIRELSVRQYPRSDVAVVIVRTAFIGADADLVRGFVTTPLERSIASADGIDYLESSSVQGLSTITAHLRLNFDVNAALTQIQAKVAQVRGDLPPEAESPTIEVENADNRFAAAYLSFYSDSLSQSQITDYLLRVIQPKLSSLEGVQRAEILGGRIFAMRVWLKPDAMAALGISPSEVQAALQANNYLAAIGNTKGNLITVSLVANTDLTSQQEFSDLVIKKHADRLVRLREVADVVLGAESYDEEVRFAGQAATFMGVWALPNANVLEVIARVRATLPQLEKALPPGMKLGVPYDSTEYIRNAIDEVLKTLLETIAIVILVIYLFLGSLRSVLVPVVAIPLSLIGGAALMLAFGFTLNLLTLLAIVLAVGLVVDDAIVMLENVERHVRLGKPPREAAIIAARELVAPTIAMTITLATVYAPIGLQGGLTGALFREFAFTLAGAVVISGIVALTLSPMMSSRLVRQGNHTEGFLGRLFTRLQSRYQHRLRQVLQVQPLVLGAACTLILAAPLLYLFSTKELAPREDQGVVFGIVQASPNSSLDQTVQYTKAVNKVFLDVPEAATSFQLTNPSGGFSGVVLKPWSERGRSSTEIEGALWGSMSQVPGVRVIVTTPPPLPGGSDFPIEFVISSTSDAREIDEFAQKLVGAAFASGKFMFADSDLKYDLPQAEIVFDREQVSAMGLDLARVGSDLGVLLGGDYTNRFHIQGRSYKVIPQVKRAQRLSPQQVLQHYISGPRPGELIPLSSVATLASSVQPRQLGRFQQLNAAKIQGAPVPGVSINDALKVLEESAATLLPAGYQIDYAGESRQLRNDANALTTTLMLALVLIFLVLAAQFESFRDPLIILLGCVPLALAAALVFVFLGLTSLNVYSQVGLVTLVGLIAKNGILIVEFANKLQMQGKPKLQAIIQGAVTRFRPVMITSVATVVGHFPLIIATGPGAGARNSIGIVLVSGMCIGTVLTLFVLPVFYMLIASSRTANVQRQGSAELDAGEDQAAAMG